MCPLDLQLIRNRIQSQEIRRVGQIVIAPAAVVDFADVDGDGDLDALAARASISTQSLVILLNDGQQRFTPTATLTTLNVGASAIRAADVDRDGDIDFAVTFEGSSSQGGVAWYENDGAWTFHDVTRNAPTEPSRAGRDVVPIDFDFDGDVDLVASTYSGSQLALEVFRNNGNENFVRETLATFGQSFASLSTQTRGDRLQVTDLDGDGRLEILASEGRYPSFASTIAPSAITTATARSTRPIAIATKRPSASPSSRPVPVPTATAAALSTRPI